MWLVAAYAAIKYIVIEIGAKVAENSIAEWLKKKVKRPKFKKKK